MTTIEEAIQNELSMLHTYAKRSGRVEAFVEGATDCIMQMYEGEITDEDAPELSAKLQEFWREQHK